MNILARLVHYRRTAFQTAALAVIALVCVPAMRAQSPDMLMGNPSNATTDTANAENFLMVKPYFALSYNDSKGTPNWVSWRLTEADIGTAARVPFYPDETLARGFHMVKPADYTGSGFDRGHMCDHSDRMVAGRPTDSHVQNQRLDEFFGELAQDHDWHGPSETEGVRHYRELWQFFRDRLDAAAVFRIGEVQVDILIVGKAADQRWVGVKTRAIET
jgi:hypothetical protein